MNDQLLELATQRSEKCRMIGNPRRLLILWILSNGELSVNEITTRAGSSLQNVSQHLSALKQANLVDTRREGQTIFYRIADTGCLNNCPALENIPEQLK